MKLHVATVKKQEMMSSISSLAKQDMEKMPLGSRMLFAMNFESGVGKVCIRAKWLIRPELIPVSVA